MFMQETEARQVIIDLGWTPTKREREGKMYLYARKWARKERYITPITRLPKLTREKIIEKLQD